MQAVGVTRPSGDLGLRVLRNPDSELLKTPMLTKVNGRDVMRYAMPSDADPKVVQDFKVKNGKNLWRGFKRISVAQRLGIPCMYGQLWAKILRADGRIEDYGLVSLRVVTTAGVAFIVDAFQNLTELENLKFHGIGTGGTAEASSDTALVTELTTAYNPDNTRATGTTTENAANIYRTVGTNTVDATAAITEHGIFSQAATGGGTLLDRSLFSALNLASGDGLQTTYDFTVNAGG